MRIHCAIIFILLASTQIRASMETFTRQHYKKYGYSILIPDSWEKQTVDFGYKQILLMTRGFHTKIRITITGTDKKARNKWRHWKKWYLTGIGSHYRHIYESSEFKTKHGMKAKLYIFEYTAGRYRILQRTVIARHRDRLMVIECYSPLSNFYRFSEVFNHVMASIKTLSQ